MPVRKLLFRGGKKVKDEQIIYRDRAYRLSHFQVARHRRPYKSLFRIEYGSKNTNVTSSYVSVTRIHHVFVFA